MKKNLHVLFVLNTTDRGERNMIIGMSRQGVQATVVCRPGTLGFQELKDAGIRVIPVTFKSKLDFSAIKQLRQLIKGENFDLVHVFSKMLLTNYTLASVGIKIPVIAYRGIVGNLSYWDPFSWLSFFNPRIARWVCVCEAIRQYFIHKKFLLFFSLFDPEKVVTIHKGHRLEWYQQSEKTEPLLPSLGVPENAKVIGCVARMKKRKGILELIRSMEKVSPELNAHLVLVGKILDDSIQQAAEKSPVKDRIHVLGFHPEAARMASEFDVICLPSLRREGLPRAVIEGMAQAIAPVVTDAGGSAELIEPSVSGLVVPPSDDKALADAFNLLLSDDKKREAMGKAAQERIAHDFSVDQTIDKTLKLYKGVLLERAGQS